MDLELWDHEFNVFASVAELLASISWTVCSIFVHNFCSSSGLKMPSLDPTVLKDGLCIYLITCLKVWLPLLPEHSSTRLCWDGVIGFIYDVRTFNLPHHNALKVTMY